jgi:hypothetical protein
MDTLFEKFYNIKDEVLAAIGKPIARRKLMSKFQSMQISIGQKVATLESEAHELNQKVSDLNLNRLLQIDAQLDVAKTDLANLGKKYKEWFGKELKDIDAD